MTVQDTMRGITPAQAALGAAWLRHHDRVSHLQDGLEAAITQLNAQFRFIDRKGRLTVPELESYVDQLHTLCERYDALQADAWDEYWREREDIVPGLESYVEQQNALCERYDALQADAWDQYWPEREDGAHGLSASD